MQIKSFFIGFLFLSCSLFSRGAVKINPRIKHKIKRNILKKNITRKSNSPSKILENLVEKKPKETIYLINNYKDRTTKEWSPATSVNINDNVVDESYSSYNNSSVHFQSINNQASIESHKILHYINQKNINESITDSPQQKEEFDNKIDNIIKEEAIEEKNESVDNWIPNTRNQEKQNNQKEKNQEYNNQEYNNQEDNNQEEKLIFFNKSNDKHDNKSKKNNNDDNKTNNNEDDNKPRLNSSDPENNVENSLDKTNAVIKKSKKKKIQDKPMINEKNNQNFIIFNINDVAGGLTLLTKDKDENKKWQMNPSIKISGDVNWQYWKINFEIPVDVANKESNLLQLKSQVNFHKKITKDIIFLFSVPLTEEGSKIDQSIDSKINEKDFNELTQWTKGKLLLMGVNIYKNFNIEMGWINNSKKSHSVFDMFPQKNNTTQFIKTKWFAKDIIAGAMVHGATLAEIYDLNGYLQYEIFNSGKLSKNPIIMKLSGLTKYVLENKNKYISAKEVSNVLISLTTEVKKIQINKESINIKISVEVKIKHDESTKKYQYPRDYSLTLEWRVFKIKLGLKEIKFDFKEVTPKYKFHINPAKLRFIEY